QNLLGKYWDVVVVADGLAALAEIKRRPPDLVVTDAMMPNLDGVGLMKAIRFDPALRDIPIIMLSARAGEESRIEGLEAGADYYLTRRTARSPTTATRVRLATDRSRIGYPTRRQSRNQI